MSEKELHEGVAVLQKEHDRLKDMNDDVSVKLQRLSSQYNDMRSYCCLRRYARIKAMIQEATRDCLREMWLVLLVILLTRGTVTVTIITVGKCCHCVSRPLFSNLDSKCG